MLDNLSDILRRKEVEFYEYASLKALSSMRLNALARYIVYPSCQGSLIEAIDLCRAFDVPHRVVGKMSNLLPSSSLYDGVLIKTDRLHSKTAAENLCVIECGARFSSAVSIMARNNFGGAEGLCHIPASVGGMVYSNAGAYGTEISDLFVCADFYNPSTHALVRLCKGDMGFGYRKSILKEEPLVLLSATLSFVPRESGKVFEEIRRLGEKRRRAQPLELPSLGSIFKAHDGVGAGFYIDRAGLKGARFGGAAVSEKHAGFIVNIGGAVPEDVLRLIDFIKMRVSSVFGIELKEEVEII